MVRVETRRWIRTRFFAARRGFFVDAATGKNSGVVCFLAPKLQGELCSLREVEPHKGSTRRRRRSRGMTEPRPGPTDGATKNLAVSAKPGEWYWRNRRSALFLLLSPARTWKGAAGFADAACGKRDQRRLLFHQSPLSGPNVKEPRWSRRFLRAPQRVPTLSRSTDAERLTCTDFALHRLGLCGE